MPNPDLKTLRWLRITGAVAAIGTAVLWVWYWTGGLPYGHVSGVWSALADDYAHGEFYRPLHDGNQYGGTRYMPLFFWAQGSLIKLGLSAPIAGAILSFASLLTLGALALRLMREWGASTPLAWPCLLLATSSISLQLLGISIKGDLLAAACSAGGLAAGLTWQRSKRSTWLIIAGLAFGAAILTKFTAGFGFVALLVWLILQRQWRPAVQLFTTTTVITLAVIIFSNHSSDGRMASNFLACASGDLDVSYAIHFLYWFARVIVQDPFFVLLLVAAIALAIRRWRATGPDLMLVYGGITLVGTVGLFASPGTDSNHLIDLLVAAVVLIAVEGTRAGIGPRAKWSLMTFTTMLVLTWIPGVPSVRQVLTSKGRPTLASIAAIEDHLALHPNDRILAENPIVPLVMGRRPEVLDPFNLRILAQRDPQIAEQFSTAIIEQTFAAVILIDWSGAEISDLPTAMANHTSLGEQAFYGEVHFPTGFLELLLQHYEITFVDSPLVVLRPIPPS